MTKTIVITGATRGLGRALLDQFAARGHVVHGCGRSADRVAELRKAFPVPHTFATVDVADDRAVRDWAASCPAPDLLINNAALMNDPAPLWEIPAASFDALLAVNVSGVMNVIRHFVPGMIRKGSGVIVNLSSGWGRSTSPNVGPYCASKWAVEGLTRSLAQELPRGMAAIPLDPGVIDTDMLRQVWSDGASAYPGPERWAVRAAERLLEFGPADSGKPASI
jgi:NAD(P)-dependent dehydrogenase (short-subunit alcohol dehydrogenase family)